jgi:hypothetical protein
VRKNLLPECEMIRMDEMNEAFERMERADVRCRFVTDMAGGYQRRKSPTSPGMPPGKSMICARTL